VSAVTSRRVLSDGADLAVWESGPADAPTILLIHGFPDTHRVWDDVAPLLEERYHVVRYDLRGAGESTMTAGARFDLPLLARDLFAVARACGGGERVHVVGHDWGGIQAWEAVADPDATSLIESFTAISGPCLDHIGHYLRTHALQRAAIRQAVRSTYVYVIGVPRLGPAAVRTLMPLSWKGLRAQGIGDDAKPSPETIESAARITGLYRDNVRERLFHPRKRYARCPVQIVVARDDRFVTPILADSAIPWCEDLLRREIDGPHWVIRTSPALIARLIRCHVDRF
jgi:pimeloyl-ACP methyl ester carboxylesterase